MIDPSLPLVVAGLLAGAHASSWGAFKDSPYEGFSTKKFVRSLVIGVAAGWFFYYTFTPDPGFSLAVGVAAILTLERFITEFYKAFIRNEAQSKYRISSRFLLLGHETTEGLRAAAATVCVVAFIAFISAPSFLTDRASTVVVAGLIGAYAGLGVACGGAWKDAPAEGFSWRKFLRSPFIAACVALALWTLEKDVILLSLATIGVERMIAEFYKTFMSGRRPGKFRFGVAHERWLVNRQVFLLPYALTWILFATQLNNQATMILAGVIAALAILSRTRSLLSWLASWKQVLRQPKWIAHKTGYYPEPQKP